MENKHTKGEWEHTSMKGTEGHCFCAQVFDGEGNSLCHIDSRYGEKEATANAKLIAASPELLEACKAARAVFDSQGIDQTHSIVGKQYIQLIESINKAENV